MTTAFLLTPFNPEAAGGERRATFRAVQAAIAAAAAAAGVELRRADSIFKAGVVVDQIRDEIAQADLIVAVCTGRNPNVFYELGIAEALGHAPILVAASARELPFDKAHCRCHMYGTKRENLKNLPRRLERALRETLAEAPVPRR